MRPSNEMPTARGRRRFSRRLRIFLAVAVAVLVIVLLSLRGIAGFYTDYLWFDSLGYSRVWRRVLVAQIGLAAIFIGAMFAMSWLNLFIADRLAPAFRPPGPEEEFVRRYQETVGARPGLVRMLVAGMFGLFWGAGAGSRWQDWILFRNRVDFGVADPQFGEDIGFYVFQLPFIRFVITWTFTALVVVLIITAAAHYLNGGIRLNATTERVTPQVKAHLSVLLALLALVKAADYWYQRYDLNFSTRGVVDGASYTDVNAQLPALRLLILISLCAVVLLIVNIRRRGWVLPVVAVGLWAFVTVVMGNIYPAIYQRLVVEPNESAKELQYIERNIDATRAAIGLDETVSWRFDPSDTELSPALIDANRSTLENIRLLDPAIVSSTFEALEVNRRQFRFAPDLDVDRYVIDGEQRTVIVAARELNPDGVEPGWENQHAAFTHGYGLAIAPANVVDRQGEPEFVVGGLPTTIDETRLDLVLEQPRIYVGENLDGYAIVNSQRCEIDFALTGEEDADALEVVSEDEPDPRDCERSSGQNQEYLYEGEDGVEAGGIFRRLAFALRFQDLNPVVSGLIKDDSRFIYNRDVDVRVRELAPILELDSDPYPAVVDGRIVYIVDAYTTSSHYPYAQRADSRSVQGGSGLRGGFNYVRNSVKVTIDAYDGTVTFYVVDPSDPIVSAYQRAFPELFTPGSEMSEDLRSHLRYPEDLFRVQTNMWGRYQLGDPAGFYNLAGAWDVAPDPGSQLEATVTATTTAAGVTTISNPGDLIDPQYVQMRLPGEDAPEFVLLRPFVPLGSDQTQKLTAFMVARMDANGKQSLTSYNVPGTDVDGPVIANRSMLTNGTVAERTTLLDQRGSGVRLGNMLTVPLDTADGEEGLLYVRPLYVLANGSQPTVSEVIVAYRDEIRICPSFGLALGALLVDEEDVGESCVGIRSPIESAVVDVDPSTGGDDGEPPTPEATPTPAGPTPTPEPTTPPPDGVQSLLEEADSLFARADQALADGDLGRYQELLDQAQARLDEALALFEAPTEGADEPTPDAGGDGGGDASPTATPTPTPSPTPETDTA